LPRKLLVESVVLGFKHEVELGDGDVWGFNPDRHKWVSVYHPTAGIKAVFTDVSYAEEKTVA